MSPAAQTAAPAGWAWRPLLLLAGLLLFLSTRSDAIQIGDSGELTAAACQGGVAHPPGYPLHGLLGQALCRLPISTPAGRVGLLSLLGGLLALLLVQALVERVTGNRWAATIAALTLATGSTFWRYASQVEVFGLHAALALALLYAALRAGQAPSARQQLGWCALAGLAGGLALSNHHSALLCLPAAVLAVLLPWRSPGQAAGRALVTMLGFGLGLLPYLQLLLADPRQLPRWGEPSSLAGLLHHFLRRDYGTFRLAISGEPAGLQNVGHLLLRLPSQTAWLLWLAGLAGMLVLLGRAGGRPLGAGLASRLSRCQALLLFGLPLLTGPLFLLLFNIEPTGIGAQVVQRFHILPVALFCVCVGIGAAAVEEQWLGQGTRESAARIRLWRGTLLGVLALSALLAYPKADLRQSYTVEDWGRNALASVEKQGLIVGTGDLPHFSIIYAQEVLGLRRDVQFVNVQLLAHRWYFEQKRRERPGFAFEYGGTSIRTVPWLSSGLRRGVAVYLAGPFYSQRASRAFAGYPVGPLFRLIPVGTTTPPPAEVAQLNVRLFRGFADRGRRPQPEHDPWSAQLLESYATSWRSIAAALFGEGERRGALQALARANDWAPWLPIPNWFGPGQDRTLPLRLPPQ